VITAATIGNIATVSADTLIAAFTIYELSKMKTTFVPTRSILNRLVLMTVRSGLSTSMIEAFSLISFLTNHASTIPVANQFLVANLYTLTLLCSLNFRDDVNRETEKSRTLSATSRAVQIHVTQQHTFETESQSADVIALGDIPAPSFSDVKSSRHSDRGEYGYRPDITGI